MIRRNLAVLALAVSGILGGAATAVEPPGAKGADVERKVDEMMGKMSVDEKIDLISGVKGFYIRSDDKIGLPELSMADGPIGVRNGGKSTAYPAGIALAATWDPQLAREFGTSMGRDARSRGFNFLLGPAVDLYRVPMCGRNAEYMGEDPLLTGTLAVQVIRGIQSQGVIATVKHFTANDQEDHRMTVSAEVDERTLRELNMRPFEMAVKDGGAWAMMCAYNKINGTYASANDWLQNQVLRTEWGFRGIEMSDWGAAHDTLGDVNGGLDLEMPSGKYMNKEAIKPLMEQGKITQATIDEKVRRILRATVAMGFLDRPQKDTTIPADDPTSAKTALQIAREGIVLLKNDGVLPLDRGSIKTLAIVGPNAHPAITGSGGSSLVPPIHATSARDGITQLAGGGVKVIAIDWDVEKQITEAIASATYDGPLSGEFFKGRFAGEVLLKRQDNKIDFDWANGVPAEGVPEKFSARWTGKIKPEKSGKYLLGVRSDDGSRVFLDGKRVINNWHDQQMRTETAVVDLEGGRDYDLKIEYYNAGGEAALQFGWSPVRPELNDQERQQIESADAVIVCAGFSPATEGEGFDRPYALPESQVNLIRAVTAANKQTIVVLNSGGNVEMADWIDKVPGLIHAWFPGQEGGTALGEILFGDVNPSGHLPATFEKKWEDSPAYGNYPGENDVVHYAEGIFLGYRYYDHKNIAPRYCFGQGLSYTTFKIDNLKIEPSGDGENRKVAVSVDMTNTGKRGGADVVQVYIGKDQGAVPRALRELKAFRRVELAPGEKKTVMMNVDRSAAAYYDVTDHAWKVEPGEYEISAGDSSRNLPVKAKVNW